MNILIADDHPLFRRGLSAYFDAIDEYTIVAQASSGKEVIEYLNVLDIDTVLLDVNLPDYSGFELLSIIKHEHIRIKVVILTMHDEAVYARHAFDLGADAYMVKDDAEELLGHCLEQLKQNEKFCSLDTEQHELHTELTQLSIAERNIFNLVSAEKSSSEIAALLSLSIRTVDNHRRNIAQKLGLRGPNALLKYAIRHRFPK